jgi:uncharacterized protein YabN with tetrapyrrole methylase and pyrophosphatase domain
MSDQATIRIAGLGPGAPGDITLSVWKALRSSSCTYLRTGKHPVVNWLIKEGILFSTFDYLYEKSASFEDVYLQIAEAVITAAQREPVLYAVPGHPLVAEESVRLIFIAAEQRGIGINLLPAVSFVDAVCSTLRLNPSLGLQIIDGLRLEDYMPLRDRPALITQVYSRMVAADAKVSLLELYPPDHPVTVVKAAGLKDEERIEVVPLYEIDRQEWIDHLTSLYIPEVRCHKPYTKYGDKNGKDSLRSFNRQVGLQLSHNLAVNQQGRSGVEKYGMSNCGEKVEVIQINEDQIFSTETSHRVLKVRRMPKSQLGPDVVHEKDQPAGIRDTEKAELIEPTRQAEFCWNLIIFPQ